MTDDPRVILTEYAERERKVAIGYVRDPQDVPRLLAAVSASLEHHQRVPLYGNAATDDEPGNCPHPPDSDLHFEGPDWPAEWLCRATPEGVVCSSCTEDGLPVAWPCPEYTAILAALTGKDGTDG